MKELKRRRVLSSDFDDEEERQRILDEVPGGDLTDDALPGDDPGVKNPA